MTNEEMITIAARATSKQINLEELGQLFRPTTAFEFILRLDLERIRKRIAKEIDTYPKKARETAKQGIKKEEFFRMIRDLLTNKK